MLRKIAQQICKLKLTKCYHSKINKLNQLHFFPLQDGSKIIVLSIFFPQLTATKEVASDC